MKKLATLLLGLSISTLSIAAKDPGQALMESFGAACKTNGGFTASALNDARAMMNTLEQLKNDPDCQNVSGAISELAILENKLNTLNTGYEYQLDIAKLEAQEVELLSQIAGQTDAGIISQLESALRGIQLDKAGLIAMDGAYSDYNGAEIRNIYAQIIQSSNQAYSAIASNQLCLDKNGGLLSSAVSLTSAIGASAMNTNPAFGFGLASLSQFVGDTVNFFRDRGFNRSIRRVADGSTVNIGLKCAMETLTNRWCELQDAMDFLELKTNYDEDSDDNDDLVKIAKLYDKDLPVFLNWLEKVKAGAPAANSADAGRRARVIFRQATVQVYTERGGGWFTEGRQLYELAQSPEARYAEIRKIINFILSEIGDRNPLTDIHPKSYIPYYLLGLNKAPTRGGFDIPFESFNPFNASDWPNGAYKPDFNLMISLYNAWIAQAQRLVTQELNQVLQPDPLQVISVYDERTSNIWKIAPAEALMNILNFIIENKPEKILDASYKELYTSTIDKLEKINRAVRGDFDFLGDDVCEENPDPNPTPNPENPVNPEDSNPDAPARLVNIEEVLARIEGRKVERCNKLEKALEIIFEEAQLEFGPIVFKNRLETIIRVAIDEYIQNADPRIGGNLARLLAADSYLDILSLISGTQDRQKIAFDIGNAQDTALKNMENFSDIFGVYINTLFKKDNSFITSEVDNSINRTKRNMRSQMCFLLASLPEWPKSIKKSYCYGSQLKSIHRKGPNSEVLTEDLLRKPFDQRSCLFHDFLEANKVYQDWGIVLPKKD